MNRKHTIKRMTLWVLTLMVSFLIAGSAFAAEKLMVNGNVFPGGFTGEFAINSGGGRISWNYDSNVLTLKNVTIDEACSEGESGTYQSGICYQGNRPLTIQLIGQNTIKGLKDGIMMMQEADTSKRNPEFLTIEGTGSLAITAKEMGIYAGAVLIKAEKVSVEIPQSSEYPHTYGINTASTLQVEGTDAITPLLSVMTSSDRAPITVGGALVLHRGRVVAYSTKANISAVAAAEVKSLLDYDTVLMQGTDNRHIEQTVVGNEKVTETMKTNKRGENGKYNYVFLYQKFGDISGWNAVLEKTEYGYDGKEKTPGATVKDTYGTALIPDQDYTITYQNNKESGIAKAIIEGTGKYSGKIEKTFLVALPIGATFTAEKVKYKVKENDTVQYVSGKQRKTVIIPDTVSYLGKVYKVTSIANKAFYNDTKLRTLQIGNKVETIGTKAFYGCKKLRTVTGGKALVSIGSRAFKGCVKLEAFTIYKKVTTIGAYAFQGCIGMNKLTVKSKKLTTETVKKTAFKGLATQDTNIVLPASKREAYQIFFVI